MPTGVYVRTKPVYNPNPKGSIGKNRGITKKQNPNLSRCGVRKGNIPWNKGATAITQPGVAKTREATLKRLQNPEYMKHWSGWYSKGLSKETDEILARRSLTNSITMKNHWQDPKFIKKIHKSHYRKPTKPEIKLGELIEQACPNEYKYVGDGEVIIGRSNPDYINTNGQKKIIELFGNYWHRNDNPQDKITNYVKYGFQTLIIWESELKEPELVLQKIKEFVEV